MLRCKKEFQRELNQKLEEYQCLASRNSITRGIDDEEYMKSLRAAYEDSSSDEDELPKRALDRKRDSLNCTTKTKPVNQSEYYHSGGYGSKNQKFMNQFREPEPESEEEGYRARVSLPKQTKKEAVPHPKNGVGSQFKNSKIKAVHKQPAKGAIGSMETSEEDDLPVPHRPLSRLHQSKPARARFDNLDEMTEDQLALVKKMVESRLEEKAKPQARPARSKPRPEETDVRLDDDFYDDKFLSLVYEMESHQDDSYVNY